METIADKLTELARRREIADKWKQKVKEGTERLEASMLWKDLQTDIENKKYWEAAVSDLELEIRREAIELYPEEKHPLFGIEIKSFSIITINDQKSALKWIAENAPACLKIEEGKFKKIAETLELPFINKSVERKAQISSDLSSYLENEK